MSKAAVIADTHGGRKFQDCYNEIINSKLNDEITEIFQIGDYFDPYIQIPYEEMLKNFNEILELREKDSRIKLCLGNHDTSYINKSYTSRTDFFHEEELEKLFTENLSKFRMAYKFGDWWISHAGITNTWLDICKKANYDPFSEPTVEDIKTFYRFSLMDHSHYGSHKSQSCVWVRPDALKDDFPEGSKQIVGHTHVEDIKLIQDEPLFMKGTLVMTDTFSKETYMPTNLYAVIDF